MSRLRYPFTEISARCRLCGAVGLTASSEHALGGRLIDWRRSHALVCPEWPRWAATKGLRIDERGALLYPNETGPYEPKSRSKAEDEDGDEDGFVDEAEVSAQPNPESVVDGAAAGLSESMNNGTAPGDSQPMIEDAAEPISAPARGKRVRAPRAVPPPEPRINLMLIPAEDLEQAELF